MNLQVPRHQNEQFALQYRINFLKGGLDLDTQDLLKFHQTTDQSGYFMTVAKDTSDNAYLTGVFIAESFFGRA